MADSSKYPLLEMVAGPEEGRRVPLPTGSHVMGRTEDVPIYLDDTSVSRNHAMVDHNGGVLKLKDLGSRNGTYLNSRKLKADEEATLAHMDEIRVGIYTFRVLLREMTTEDEARAAAPAPEPAPVPTPEIQEAQAAENAPEPEPNLDSAEDPISDAPPVKQNALVKAFEEDNERVVQFDKKKKVVKAIIAGALLLLILLSVFYYRAKQTAKDVLDHQDTPPTNEADIEDADFPPKRDEVPKINTPSIEVPKQDAPKQDNPPKTETPPVTEGSIAVPPNSGAQPPVKQTQPYKVVTPEEPIKKVDNLNTTLPVFLDISSEPLTARVSLEGKDLGQTPLKTNLPLSPGKDYELTADFELRDVRDHYQEKVTFKADLKKEVVSVRIKAQLATVKVVQLPRNVGFSLQGYYAYDTQKSSPVSIKDVIYGKPIYLPYGDYSIELREKQRVGESNTYVEQIRYHRDFTLNAERPVVELSIGERDLQFFPASIHSSPSGANLFVDGEKVGVTPYQGDLPLGEHEIKLTRDGYFDYVTPLDMRTNTPFESTIELKTSKVGELINKAKDLKRASQYQSVVDTLVEALKMDAAEREKAEIHYLLADAFYQLGNKDQALVYFDQAKSHPDFYYKALLGTARVLNEQGERNRSLTLLVEVLLNNPKDLSLKNEAQALFTKVSPLKSVLYIRTEPAGATVFVNSLPVQQKTPLILSDLALGNYRLEVQLTGYKTETVKQNLKVSEFVPIDLKLKPEQL